MLSRRLSLPKCVSPSAGSSSRRNSTSGKSGEPALTSDGAEATDTNALSASVVNVAGSAEKEMKDRETAIKVVIRVRPLSEKELVARSPVVVNVAKSSVQVINPALFSDPTFLGATSTATCKYSVGNVPIALSAQAITAATQAGECRTFHFDRCFGVDNAAANESEPFANAYDIDVATQRPNQELVFEEIGKDIIPSAFQGFNCTVFAYGQTGSGKTHTMVGEKSTIRGKGVIPRVCEALFQGIDARRAKENELAEQIEAVNSTAGGGDVVAAGSPSPAVKKTVFTVQMSYCEIYKEKVHDLLDGTAATTLTPTSSFTSNASSTAGADSPSAAAASASINRGKVLKVREHPLTGPFVEGLSTRLVNSYEEISEEMLAGDKLRTVAATLMNPVSSRSHALFTLTLTQTTFDAVTNVPSVKVSKISMIDLAGSERANVSGTSGDRLKEGAMINKSLTTLGRVISALSKSSASERVPYRDSTLTWLLKESLGGNAKTTMIAMVSPAAENYDETMSTLRYAESAKKVMNRAVINEDPNARIIRQLRDEIQQLKEQLALREKEAFFLAENLKDNAELPSTVQDREEFYRAMQDEIEVYKAQVDALQMKHLEEEDLRKKASRIIRFHPVLPSLINTKSIRSWTENDVLAYTLAEGISIVGTTSVVNDLEDVPNAANASMEDDTIPSRRLIRNTSWAGSFLKRRKSSTAGSVAEQDDKSSSPRKRQPLPRRASRELAQDAPTEIPTAVLPLHVNDEGGATADILAKHAVIFVRARIVSSEGAALGDQDTVEYVVEVQPLAFEAMVKVNGTRVVTEQRTRLRHGDMIEFSDQHCFRLHVPHEAFKTIYPDTELANTKSPDTIGNTSQPLEDLIAEGNRISDKLHLGMEFSAVKEGKYDEIESARVLVKKQVNHHYHLVFWSQNVLEEQVALLKHLETLLQQPLADMTSTPILEENEHPHDEETQIESPDRISVSEPIELKLSAVRDADCIEHMSEAHESENDASWSSHTGTAPASMLNMDGHYSTAVDTNAAVVASTPSTHLTPPQSLCIRLLGCTRIHFSGLHVDNGGDRAVHRHISISTAIYDTRGKQIARLYGEVKNLENGVPSISGEKKNQESGGIGGNSLLKRGLSFLSPRHGQPAIGGIQSNDSIKYTRIEVVIERIEFLTATSSEQVSLTLRAWSAGLMHSGEHSNPSPGESTPKISSNELTREGYPIYSPNHSVIVSAAIRHQGVWTSEDYLTLELWGYGELFIPRTVGHQSPVHPVELFVSVDIEERDADGFYRPVTVKSDGTLRLHANQPRRVSLRITQADHGPFVLREFCLARLSPSFSTHGATNLSIGDGKSTQSLLLPPTQSRNTAKFVATTEVDDLPTFREWSRLFPRSSAEVDLPGRSLNASLRWEHGPASDSHTESSDEEDSRSVFRLAIVFKTTLSNIPVVIFKSIVTKFSAVEVSSSQRLAREWENSRTAWWARESFSRSYRLGTWYNVDIARDGSALVTRDMQSESTSGDEVASTNEHVEPPAVVALTNAHINGLRRLELCFAMERVRQEIVTRYLVTRLSDEYPLTLERAQECFEQLLGTSAETTSESIPPPVIKVLQLDDGALYLRHKANKEIFIALESGDVRQLSGDEEVNEDAAAIEHVTHFVSEPTALMSDSNASSSSNGEMCGFLMFSTSVQLDESAVMHTSGASSPSSSSNPLAWAKNTLSSRLGWERRWFVLKRPFLYAYKSFARKEQIGVLDVVKCQLVVPSSSSYTGRRPSLPGNVTQQGGVAEGSTAPSTTTALPFCFQLVSLAGSKCVVWSLQASTQAELRAWLVAIDPLKIEAREAVIQQAQADGVAVATA